MFRPTVGNDTYFYPGDPRYPHDPALGEGLWTYSRATLTKVYLDAGATVTYVVEDDDGVNLAGETWPQTATFVSGSLGKFVVLLRDTIAFQPHVECNLVITIDYGADALGRLVERLHPILPGQGP